jgi:hypothetical protein
LRAHPTSGGAAGPGKIEKQALDAGIGAKLWEASERLTGVAFE